MGKGNGKREWEKGMGKGNRNRKREIRKQNMQFISISVHIIPTDRNVATQ